MFADVEHATGYGLVERSRLGIVSVVVFFLDFSATLLLISRNEFEVQAEGVRDGSKEGVRYAVWSI